MDRRHLLAILGSGFGSGVAGCVADDPPGTGDGTSDSPTESPTPGGTPVSVVARADQPDVAVEYGVEVAEPRATDERPARVRITITNPTESTVALGEERDVQFHHVASANRQLYLHPAGDEAWTGPVEPGCWRLTEPVAVPEYYGIIEVEPGETRRAASLVYGNPGLPEGECLPAGEHRVRTEGVAGEGIEEIGNEELTREFAWGFTLRVGASG